MSSRPRWYRADTDAGRARRRWTDRTGTRPPTGRAGRRRHSVSRDAGDRATPRRRPRRQGCSPRSRKETHSPRWAETQSRPDHRCGPVSRRHPRRVSDLPRSSPSPTGLARLQGMDLRFAIGVPNVGPFADSRLITELALLAERSGWDAIFVWDHLLYRDDWPVVDPWVTLGTVLSSTDRLVAGLMVAALPRQLPWE